jgi:hypothetical protein
MKRPSILLSTVLAILAACSLPPAVMGEDGPQAAKPAGQTASPSTPPMIVHNPDGTFTIQKTPPNAPLDPKATKGLVIPPQVVVPIVSAPSKQN